jgi:hypothetical protein
MPLEGKKTWIHEKITHLPKGQKIETQEIHASNDGNMVVEMGIQQTQQTQNQQRPFYESIWKKGRKIHLHQRYGKFRHALAKRNKKQQKKDTPYEVSFFIYQHFQISNSNSINSKHLLTFRVLKERYVKTSNIGTSIFTVMSKWLQSMTH